MITQKTLKRLSAMMKQAVISSESNTDEQALETAALYPEWNEVETGAELAEGSRVNHDGKLYKVLSAHQKQDDWNPAAAPSLFAKVLIPDSNVIPAWEQPDSTNPYMKGDKVEHKGKTWESLVDNNVWEPGATGTESLWKKI